MLQPQAGPTTTNDLVPDAHSAKMETPCVTQASHDPRRWELAMSILEMSKLRH